MARIKYAPDITKITNEHQGFTFQNTRQANVMMKGQSNDRHRSTRQQNRQVNLINPSSHWRTLTPAQRANWELYAATYPQPTKKSGSVFLTGYQLFKKRCQYCHLNYDIANGFIFSPVMEELPAFTFTPTIEQTVNVIDVTEPYIKQFGVIPAPGQWILFKAVPMAVKSGQFYPTIYDQLQVIDSYIDGLFVSLEIPPGTPEVVISVFLSKPFNQSVKYSGTKTRYMGCFTSKKFIDLTDVPPVGVPDAGKVWGVDPEGNWNPITPGGGGGLTCETLAACPTIISINQNIIDIAGAVVINLNTSIPAIKFGLLYPSEVIDSPLKIAPAGWHAITYTEAQAISTFLGGNTVSGKKMKEPNSQYWAAIATADNLAKINGRGAGYRYHTNGVFSDITVRWRVRCSDVADAGFHKAFTLLSSQPNYYPFTNMPDKEGASIRLVKDVTTLIHGQSSSMFGNNGRIYRTICVGGYEITADNLCETKFRDGTEIPEVTDASLWVSLSGPKFCAYSNNWANV